MDTPTAAASSYEDLPYPGMAHPATHPAGLCAVATLLGLAPPAPATARVLEIGCGDGTNLIHIAETLPGAELYGFDYTARHIGAGKAVIAALGVTNVRLEHRDIMDFGPGDGQYDYIVAHGVYSWVPAPVRARVLEICGDNLAPNGIAFVSYNAYPGWHAVDGVRQMMLRHIDAVGSAAERVGKARDLLSFLVRNVPRNGSPYSVTLNAYAAQVAERDDSAFAHDELSPESQPFYLTEFVQAAEEHGLAYLHEARFSDATGMHLSAETLSEISTRAHSPLEAEQLADLVSNRSFRRAVLCHPEQLARRNFDVDAARLRGFFVRGQFHARPQADGPSTEVRAGDRTILAPREPIGAAALTVLGEVFPAAIAFEALVAAALARLPGTDPTVGGDTIAATLALAYSMPGELLTLWPHDPGYLAEPPERPLAGAFGRYQAARGQRDVSDRLHRWLELDPTCFLLLPLLDGQHTRAQLLSELVSAFPGVALDVLTADLDTSLHMLSANAMLIPA